MTTKTPQPVAIQRWIPVTERLPTSDADVLGWVVDDLGRGGFALVCFSRRFQPPQWLCLETVTHWMPLPPPPTPDAAPPPG